MQLILVGGAQRSGTTLLQTLLANALNSPVLPEAHILADILASFKRAKQFGNKTRFFYPAADDLVSFFKPFAERYIADIVAGAGPIPALVLKEPHFVEVLDEASDLFPKHVRVVCIRDPRDIAASFVQIGLRQHAGGKQSKYEKRDIEFIAGKILAFYSPLLNSHETPVLVRYEDLVSEPRATLQVFAQHTELELSLDRIEEPIWLEADARHQPSWVTRLEGQKPSQASVGSFRRVLRADEIATVQKICRPIMKRFGYVPEVPSPRLYLLAKSWALQTLFKRESIKAA